MKLVAVSRSFLSSLILLISFSLLQACGGGGGGGSPAGDTTAPVITLNGASNAGVVQGDVYTEEGATAEDDVDGSVTVKITGTVDVNTPADYTITYTATDSSNNTSTVTRTVIVRTPLPFVTTWKTDNLGVTANNQVQISTMDSSIAGLIDVPIQTYNYSIDWGDGQSNVNVTGDITHTYDVPGVYTITINGIFPHIIHNTFKLKNDGLKLLSIEQWGDIKWKSMFGAFGYCENLVINAVDTPDLSQVLDMRSMFIKASSFNQDITSWDVSNVNNMAAMFAEAFIFNQDISSWNVSKVTNMASMFRNASNFNADISGWDVSSVTDMSGMFTGASSFNQNIGIWDVSFVTNMSGMFGLIPGALGSFGRTTSFNQDLSSWNVSSVTDMSGMFDGATSFNKDIGSWDVSSVANMAQMFRGITYLQYDSVLNGWSSRILQNNVTFDAGNSIYSISLSQTARDALMTTYGWVITDGGSVP